MLSDDKPKSYFHQGKITLITIYLEISLGKKKEEYIDRKEIILNRCQIM